MHNKGRKILILLQAAAMLMTSGMLCFPVEICAEQEIEKRAVNWLGQGENLIAETIFSDGQLNQIFLGSYYQNDKEGSVKEPVLWNILELDGNKIYLLSDKILDILPYQTPHANSVYWETCTLRSWLNSEEYFLGEIFSESEKDMLFETEVSYDAYAQGDDTAYCTDFLTVLSYKEAINTEYNFARRPVESCEVRQAQLTAYAAEKIGADEGQYGRWWLRSMGTNVMNASFVDENGKVDAYQSSYLDAADTGTGVRPACYLDIDTVLYVTESAVDKAAEFMILDSEAVSEQTIWNLTVADGNEAFQAENLSGETFSAGDKLQIEISNIGEMCVDVKDALKEKYDQITAILIDEEQNIRAYGKVAEAEKGTIDVTLPKELDKGTYELKLFAEYVQSEKEGTESFTDYASNAESWTITVE